VNGKLLIIISLSCNALWGMYRIYKKTTAATTCQNVGGVVWMLVSMLAFCVWDSPIPYSRKGKSVVSGRWYQNSIQKAAGLPKQQTNTNAVTEGLSHAVDAWTRPERGDPSRPFSFSSSLLRRSGILPHQPRLVNNLFMSPSLISFTFRLRARLPSFSLCTP
jgi:hypothetical protein